MIAALSLPVLGSAIADIVQRGANPSRVGVLAAPQSPQLGAARNPLPTRIATGDALRFVVSQ